jgi:HK97 family phage prohead protease
MSDVIMQYDHRGRVFARNSNGTLKLSTDEHGLKVTADLAGTQMGRDLYEEIRGGYTDKMSFGFTIREKSREITENEDGTVTVWQRINKVKKLYDVSAVSIPANPNTSISSFTRTADIDGEIEEVRKEIAARRERNKERERLALRLKLLEVSNNDD